MILLTAELETFKANPEGQTVGTVIESKVMQGKGPTATIIIQNGTLKLGDIVSAGPAYGRIRSLEDEHGKKLKEVLEEQAIKLRKSMENFGLTALVIRKSLLDHHSFI
jgi:translation initiation factor IF-2